MTPRMKTWTLVALIAACVFCLSSGAAWAQETRLERTYKAGKVDIVVDAVVDAPAVQNAQPLRVRYMNWTDERIARIWKEDEPAPAGGETVQAMGRTD